MEIVIVLFLVTIILMIAAIVSFPSITIKKKKIGTYWIITLIGALLLIIFGKLSISEVFSGLTAESAINPIKILVLFLSMTVLSIFLDELGFFRYLASVTLEKSKSSPKKLFFALYIMVSVLTIFTSNDIVILTFTPFICYFAKNSKINPIPFLIAEFVAANTWSMLLIIGNPTNVYLATASGINFFQYFTIMLLPTILAGLTSLIIIYLLFRKSLNTKIYFQKNNDKLDNSTLLLVGMVHLVICTVFLVFATYLDLEMYLIALISMISLLICTLFYKLIRKNHTKVIISTLQKAPYELIPFVISMFIFVMALDKYGITGQLANALGQDNLIAKYGIISTLSANIINNIPMSVLFSSIICGIGSVSLDAVFATIIGSNIGAFLTPIGALAGIMWLSILKVQGIKLSIITFVKYGIVIAIPTLTMALVGLAIVI